jgi:PAS domain-containing protein
MLLCAQFFDADSDVLSRTANGRASERGLQRLLELTCDWCFALDAAVRLAHVEQRCLADPASPVSDWLGHPPWKWHGVSADSPDLARLRAALEAQAPFRDLECALRDRRGHQRYLSFSAEPVFDGAGRFAGYCGAARDVTARRRAEALAALEHAVTRSLAEADTSRNVLQAVMRIICESENWETAGFFRAEDELGTTRLIAGWSGPGMAQAAAEYYRQTVDRVIPPGGMLSKVIAEGKPLWVEEMKEGQTTWSQRVRHTGERATFFVPLRVDGLVHGVFAFASREIREPDEPLLCTLGVIGDQVGQFLKRKHAEQVLRESEARFRALTGLSSDWYWESDASFRLTRIEGRDVEAAEAGHGQGAIGKCRWETGLAMDDPAGWDEHRAQLETHLPFRDVVMVRRGPGDSCRYIAVSGEPVHDARGVFLGYRGVGRDISERKVAENRIRHLASHDGLIKFSLLMLSLFILKNEKFKFQNEDRNHFPF